MNISLNGIINVLKPPGMSSHDVVAHIRKIIGIKKIGHSGTLDPSAVGVLPIFIGRATKTVEYAIEGTKSYRAELKLGVITDTGDKDGNIISTDDWKKYFKQYNYEDTLEKVIQSFKGKSKQLPPMYSAIKINGQKLYNLARQGKEIRRAEREIEINEINIISSSYEEGLVLFDVDCSKGTYIRVLCEDIGRNIGCGAHMSYLIRTKSSGFCLQESHTIEEIKDIHEKNRLLEYLIPIEKLFSSYTKYVVADENQIKMFMNGCRINIDDTTILKDEPQVISVYINEKLVGLANIFEEENNKFIKVKKFFV